MKDKIVVAVSKDSSFKEPLLVTFRKLGYEVFEFDYRANSYLEKFLLLVSLTIKSQKKLIIKLRNKRLINLVRKVQPAILFVSKGELITAQTIDAVKAEGIITINWFSDLFDLQKYVFELLPHYDLVFTADNYDVKKNKKLMNLHHLPYGGWQLKKHLDFKNRRYNVVFIGAWSKEREELMFELRQFNPMIWGNSKWRESKVKQFFQNKWLSPQEVLEIFQQTKIAINQHQYITDKNTTLNIRVYEATSNGAMVITDFRKELPKLFKLTGKNKEMVLLKNKKQAKEMTGYYLSHNKERIFIAKNGYKKTLSDHTFENRLKIVLSLIKKNKRKKI